jgi:hypothetical protein
VCVLFVVVVFVVVVVVVVFQIAVKPANDLDQILCEA